MIPIEAQLYSQTGAYHNHYHKDFVQQMKRTDAETYTQTLEGNERIICKRLRKDRGSQRDNDTIIKPTESTNLDSQGLIENEPTISEPA